MLVYKKILLSFILLFSYVFSKNLILHDYDGPSQQNQANHTLDTTINGDILIVVGMLGGIDFYNISNPAVLNHLDNLQLSGGGGGGQGGGSKPNCLVTSGNYAYVTTSNGLGIINISNPSNPQSLGMVSGTNGYILENLDVHNNLLAIAAHEDGVLLYDISNPISPNYISTIEAENAWSVTLTDYYMYIADGVNLLVYYSFDDSSNYSLMSSIELSNAIKDIAVGNGYIFVAIGSDGVVAMSTIGDEPQIIDTYNTSALANRIEIFDNNKVAVSDWDDVEVLELNSDNSSLDLVGYKNTTRRTMAIATKGNFIYSAEWKSVQVFEYGEVNGPDIDLNMYELNYPYVDTGESYMMTLEVTNNGNSILEITDAYTTNSEFSYDTLSDLNPGESQNVNIIYTANAMNASGSYRIYSNDSDENEIVCETNGNINGANVGDQAPDFNLPIMYNGTGNFQLSDNLDKVVVLAFFAPN